MPVLVVIPARLGSTRLPHKPLQLLAGEPLIVRVARHVMDMGTADRVVVATDAKKVDPWFLLGLFCVYSWSGGDQIGLYAALSLGRSSGLVKLRQQEKPEFVQFLIGTSGDRLFAEGGGRLVRDAKGNVIGAVGVTGDTEENDDALAAHGIHAAGLKIDEDCKGFDEAPNRGVHERIRSR
jgi:hypothetical protein